MNQTSLVLGVEAVKDEAWFQECVGRIVDTRERAKQTFTELGFSYPEPSANFIFVTHPKYPAKDLFAALREKDIYVRYFNQPRIDNYLRVTIGTDAQMNVFFDYLRQLMA
jgi:histidinol-phosphate aminotransferase